MQLDVGPQMKMHCRTYKTGTCTGKGLDACHDSDKWLKTIGRMNIHAQLVRQ